jgi:hypothetical protein
MGQPVIEYLFQNLREDEGGLDLMAAYYPARKFSPLRRHADENIAYP